MECNTLCLINTASKYTAMLSWSRQIQTIFEGWMNCLHLINTINLKSTSQFQMSQAKVGQKIQTYLTLIWNHQSQRDETEAAEWGGLKMETSPFWLLWKGNPLRESDSKCPLGCHKISKIVSKWEMEMMIGTVSEI